MNDTYKEQLKAACIQAASELTRFRFDAFDIRELEDEKELSISFRVFIENMTRSEVKAYLNKRVKEIMEEGKWLTNPSE